MMEKKKVEMLKDRDQIIRYLRDRSITSMMVSLKAVNNPKANKGSSAFADGIMMACMELLYCMGEPVPAEIHEMISNHIELVPATSGSSDIDKTNN